MNVTITPIIIIKGPNIENPIIIPITSDTVAIKPMIEIIEPHFIVFPSFFLIIIIKDSMNNNINNIMAPIAYNISNVGGGPIGVPLPMELTNPKKAISDRRKSRNKIRLIVAIIMLNTF